MSDKKIPKWNSQYLNNKINQLLFNSQLYLFQVFTFRFFTQTKLYVIYYSFVIWDTKY